MIEQFSLKSPNSRVCALKTIASFLALSVLCVPGPMKVALGSVFRSITFGSQ